MKRSLELLEKILNKIKSTPDEIIEKAMDRLAEKLKIETFEYYIKNEEISSCEYNKYEIESENEKWMENLQLVA